MKRKTTFFKSFLMLAALIFLGMWVNAFGFALIPVTTRYAYEPILKYRWESPEIVAHFPRQIPSSAKDVGFYYLSALLQGGTTIELKMSLPPDERNAIEKDVRMGAARVLDWKGHDLKTGTRDTSTYRHVFETVSTRGDEARLALLPKDFVIYVLHEHPYQDNPVSWNHGKAAGVAVSQKKNAVIYWADNW